MSVGMVVPVWPFGAFFVQLFSDHSCGEYSFRVRKVGLPQTHQVKTCPPSGASSALPPFIFRSVVEWVRWAGDGIKSSICCSV